MKKLLLYLLLSVGFGYYVTSCSADQLLPPPPPPLCDQFEATYEDHVQGIMNAQCNTAGCHDNQSLGLIGDYNTLDQARLERIYQRVVVDKDMPPLGMDQSYRDTIRCWQEQGFLQN